ncbi:hypothetical protein [Streptomyces sp. NPDC059708]|uniref:hypothetical protein n=1 Tax=Streptomyces sp. NPDC059708 TaxID=3346916 RepID=UPI00368CC3AA
MNSNDHLEIVSSVAPKRALKVAYLRSSCQVVSPQSVESVFGYVSRFTFRGPLTYGLYLVSSAFMVINDVVGPVGGVKTVLGLLLGDGLLPLPDGLGEGVGVGLGAGVDTEALGDAGGLASAAGEALSRVAQTPAATPTARRTSVQAAARTIRPLPRPGGAGGRPGIGGAVTGGTGW